jgi:hypothetical protein
MSTRRHDLLALAILTSLILLLFADVLSGIHQLSDRDLLPYSYPARKVLRDVVLGGELPYWARAISGGQPLAANPANTVFYPPTWLILLPGYPYGLQLFIVLHVALAGASMYALVRSLARSPAASLFAAISFALGGIVLSYITLLPFLASVAWMPLTLLFARRWLRERARRDFCLAVLCLAMQLAVGEPTTLLQTGMLLGIHALWAGAARGGAKGAAAGVIAAGAIGAAALLAAAVVVLPGLDHAADSVRARPMPFEQVTEWSMPPARLGELLHASLFGHDAYEGLRLYWGRVFYGTRGAPFLISIYPGLLVALLAVAGMIARVRGRALLLVVLGLSVVLALGAHTPLWRILYDAGVVSSLRYPEKFMLMGVFAAIVFAAKVLDEVLRGDGGVRRTAMAVALVIAAGAIACAAIALSPLHAGFFQAMWTREPTIDMLAAARSGWMLMAARAAGLLVLLGLAARVRRPLWLAAAGLFVLADLGLRIPELARRTTPDFMSERPPVLASLPPDHSQYRLFHHAAWHRRRQEVLPYYYPHPDVRWVDRNAAVPLIPAAHGIQLALAGDYDHTFLLPSADFARAVDLLTWVRPDWIDVVASMSNVWYRAVIIDPAAAMARAGGDRRRVQPVALLRLPRYPRYFFARHLRTVRDPADFVRQLAPGRSPDGTTFIAAPSFQPAAGVVRNVRETANTARLDVETGGRAFLVMSVTPHKYWTVTIDGVEAETVVTNVGYQGVIVPAPGRHVVEMRYRNPLIAAGGGVSLAALLALLMFGRQR